MNLGLLNGLSAGECCCRGITQAPANEHGLGFYNWPRMETGLDTMSRSLTSLVLAPTRANPRNHPAQLFSFEHAGLPEAIASEASERTCTTHDLVH